MTTSAWVFMLAAWSIIITMTIYFFGRLISSKNVLQSGTDAEERPEPWGAPPTLHDG